MNNRIFFDNITSFLNPNTELSTYKQYMLVNLTRTYNINIKRITNIYNNDLKLNRFKRLVLINIRRQYNNDSRILLENYNLDKKRIDNYVPLTVNATKKHKALLVGINYTGVTYNNKKVELKGCINDITNMSAKLKETNKFVITTLTDETPILPTRVNIITEFTKLLCNANPGDLLYFHFSGHGSNIPDVSGDELDGFDDVIFPLDMKLISDDELKIIINENLKKDVALVAVFDCCSSGSVLDLKYQYLDSLSSDKDSLTIHPLVKETEGRVFCISGCDDTQTSADVYISKQYQGAATESFIYCLNKQSNCTWRDLLVRMRSDLKTRGFIQIPQISTGQFEGLDQSIFFL